MYTEFLKLTCQRRCTLAPRYHQLQKRAVTGVIPSTDLEKKVGQEDSNSLQNLGLRVMGTTCGPSTFISRSDQEQCPVTEV